MKNQSIINYKNDTNQMNLRETKKKKHRNKQQRKRKGKTITIIKGSNFAYPSDRDFDYNQLQK